MYSIYTINPNLMENSYYLNLILFKIIVTVINVKILPIKKDFQLGNKNYEILKIFNAYISIYYLFLIFFFTIQNHFKKIKSIFKNSTIF